MSNSELPRLPLRAVTSHKGDFGHVLLIGGSRGMSGAVALAGMSALRSGAGLVTLATADVCLDVVAGFAPEYMTVPLPTDADGRIASTAQTRLLQLAETASTVAIGPGLGRSKQLDQLIPVLVSSIDKPLVIDADGLNALATALHDASFRFPASTTSPVLTPHPGEFRRLVGDAVGVAAQRDQAQEFAAQHGAIVLLKGHRTLITDGAHAVENHTGNPGMATGGSGDVLTGVIAGLLAQNLSPFQAAQLGAHLHGMAGDIAAAELGQVSMVAGDLIRSLPAAFTSFANENRQP